MGLPQPPPTPTGPSMIDRLRQAAQEAKANAVQPPAKSPTPAKAAGPLPDAFRVSEIDFHSRECATFNGVTITRAHLKVMTAEEVGEDMCNRTRKIEIMKASN